MSTQLPEYILPMRVGLSQITPSSKTVFGEGTINVYPDITSEGYLVNYPGRVDDFERDIGGKTHIGTPPSTAIDITRMETFRDYLGGDHVVFVQGDEVCRRYGNGYISLVTLRGKSYDGKFFPALLIHDGKLFIANEGDPVYVWDGVNGICTCGVLETPLPPELRESAPPYGDYIPFGVDEFWVFPQVWWPEVAPPSGPAENTDSDGNKLWGYYEVVVQFMDRYGNMGPVSPPSILRAVKPGYDITNGVTREFKHFLYGDFTPPQHDTHIAAVFVGRTLNQNPAGGSGVSGVYHVEEIISGTTTSRYNCQLSDSVLAASDTIDTEVGPPPSLSGLAAWKRRLVGWGGPDKNVLYVMDANRPGQNRPLNNYRAKGHVLYAGSLGDRLVVVTTSGTDVLYEAADGSLGILEQHPLQGSQYGRSFTEVDGRVFGLWNSGFYFYDGQSWRQVETPYWLKAPYMDPHFFVYSAKRWGEFYVLSFRHEYVTDGNNRILLYHIPEGKWYILEESVYDMMVVGQNIYGCDDSIYQLFHGGTFPSAKIRIRGYIPPELAPSRQRTVGEVRILMEPSSNLNIDLSVTGTLGADEMTTATAPAIPSANSQDRTGNLRHYWNEVTLEYGDGVVWTSPGDCWITPQLNGLCTSYAHDISIDFPAGHLVRVKALAVSVSKDSKAGY